MRHRTLLAITCLIALLLFPAASAQQAGPAQVSILFDAQGGAFPGGAGTQAVSGQPGTEAAFPDAPVKGGFVFGGWYTMASGEGDRLQPPAAMPQADTACFAWWVPEEQTEVYTLTVTWADGLSGNTERSYRYNFVEKATGACYPLFLSSAVTAPGKAVMRGQIRLPGRTPQGVLASYGVDQDQGQGCGLFFGGIPYTISYQETDERGSLPGQFTYFNRAHLLRRMVMPAVTVNFVGAPPQETALTLSMKPADHNLKPVKATAPYIPTEAESALSLPELFAAKRAEFRHFALDDVDYQLNCLGRNAYTLAGAELKGFTQTLTGDAEQGFTLTYTKK